MTPAQPARLTMTTPSRPATARETPTVPRVSVLPVDVRPATPEQRIRLFKPLGAGVPAELIDAEVVAALHADLGRRSDERMLGLFIVDGAVLDPPAAIHGHEQVPARKMVDQDPSMV